MTCLGVSCHFCAPLPLACVDDSCLSRSCTRVAIPTVLHLAAPSFVTLAPASSLFFDLALCFVVSGHASTQTCAQISTGLHVWWSLLALFLTLAFRTSGTISSAPVHDTCGLTFGLSALRLCPSCQRKKDKVWCTLFAL